MSNHVVVVAEVRDGKLKRPSLEAITAARQIHGGGPITALVLGHNLDAAAAELQKAGVKVVAVDDAALARYSGDGFAQVAHQHLKELAPAAVLMPHSAMGKDLMPRIAALLETGLVTDVTALHHDGARLGATKPVFAGKALLKVWAARKPFMATLRPNNFAAAAPADGGSVSKAPAGVDAAAFASVVKEVVAAAAERVPLQEARVVVSGGRGLKEAGHFKLVEDLAAAFGPGVATVGASRAVTDAGWRPHREQVGQTGKVVSPTLYIACGISGAIQHLAGMRTSKVIVAINKDPEAPIFKVADYGIVGDVFEVLPALTKAVQDAVAHR